MTVAGWYCALGVLGLIAYAIWRLEWPTQGFVKLMVLALEWGFAIFVGIGALMSNGANIWLLVIAFRDSASDAASTLPF